jgi:hypothetical protein
LHQRGPSPFDQADAGEARRHICSNRQKKKNTASDRVLQGNFTMGEERVRVGAFNGERRRLGEPYSTGIDWVSLCVVVHEAV